MSNWWKSSALIACGLVLAATPAVADKPKAKSSAETGLIGIKLYDAGLKVIKIYGTPDEIQAVGFGGGGTAFGGGGGGAGGGFPGRSGGGAPSFGPRGGGGGAGAGAPRSGGKPSGGAGVADSINPFDFGDEMIRQFPGGPGGGGGYPGVPGGSQGGPPPGFGGSGGIGGPGGAPPGYGGPGAGGGRTGGGTPPSAGGAAERVTYTRWVYNRQNSKYGFVIDKMGRVVQIEAIGMENKKVTTRRGVGFGATFAELIKKYNQPDGYEIGGDNILVKYLVRQKVAFRLSRLGPKKPQVVTGIVVAAGKS